MDPANNKGVTIVKQPFDMDLFMNRQVDSASAMTYNELAQVLETKNPKTGKLYKLCDLNVIKMENVGTGDARGRHLHRRDNWIKDKANQATAKKFLAASFKGWIYCRDHAEDCVKIVLERARRCRGPPDVADERDQRAVWPAAGHRHHGQGGVQRTAKIAKQFGVIKKPPSGAYRDDLAKAAVAPLKARASTSTARSGRRPTSRSTAGGK